MARLTSNWVKNRWSVAREQRDLYNSQFNSDYGVKEFYKSENVLSKKLMKYEVTLELNFQGQGYEFSIPQESFTFYSYAGLENESHIKENTKQAVSSIFRGRSQNWIYNNVDVQVRGMEKKNLKREEININKLKYSNAYSENVPKIKVSKNRRNGSSNVNDYNLNLWS